MPPLPLRNWSTGPIRGNELLDTPPGMPRNGEVRRLKLLSASQLTGACPPEHSNRASTYPSAAMRGLEEAY